MRKSFFFVLCFPALILAENPNNTLEQDGINFAIVQNYVKSDGGADMGQMIANIHCRVKNDSKNVIFLSNQFDTDFILEDFKVVVNKKTGRFSLGATGQIENYISRTYLMLDVNRYSHHRGTRTRSEGSERDVKFAFRINNYLRIFDGEYQDGSGKLRFDSNLSNYESVILEGKVKIVMFDAKKDIGWVKKVPFVLNFKVDRTGNVFMLDQTDKKKSVPSGPENK